MLPVAVDRSSCDVVAIRYVLLVLWMTSHFHTVVLRRVVCIPKRRQNTTSRTADNSSRLCSTCQAMWTCLNRGGV